MAVSEVTLLAQLKGVHRLLRRDLASCRKLAAQAADGASPAQLRSGLATLRSRGPLFELRAGCIQHCHFVHAHHSAEDTGLFAAVRRVAPHLRGTLETLKADHRVISDLLDEVEGSARAVENSAASRTRLVEALTALSDRLLAHLDFEETALGPTLLTMAAMR